MSRLDVAVAQQSLHVVDADAGGIVELSAEELLIATQQELARELVQAVRGRPRGRYRTYWPQPARKRRGVARRWKPSAQRWRISQQRRGRYRQLTITLRNEAPYSSLLEGSETIRGRRNRHYLAAYRTIEEAWPVAAGIAQSRAQQRAGSNRVRRIHAQRARQARQTGGWSRHWDG